VILMHAASGNSDCWVQQLPAFTAAGYRCIAYDRRGWGRSEPRDTGEQPGYASDDLLGLVDHFGLDRFHLVATAAGAGGALDFALSHGDRIRALVIADCTGGVQDPEFLAMLDRIRPPEVRALPAELRELSASYRGTNPEGTRRFVEILQASRWKGLDSHGQKARNHVTLALLETLRVPTLVLVGDADYSTPPAVVRQIADHIPNSQYATLPAAGHGAFWEQPELWNRLVLDFLRQH
jgi:pimeloyl-ACP methyl ester carboxylesterase